MGTVGNRARVSAHRVYRRLAATPLGGWMPCVAPSGDGGSPRSGAIRRKHTGFSVTALAFASLAFALVLLTEKASNAVHYGVTILHYPFQIDDAEGVILAEAAMIARTMNPYAYQPSPAHHFYAGPYTPLYTAVIAAIHTLVGPVLMGGRAVQLLATLTVALWIVVAIGRSVRHRAAWVIGVWAALLFLTCHLVAHWAVMVRPDMMAMACNLAGVTLLGSKWSRPARSGWREEPWPRGRTVAILALGAGCFALGWWTKQTFVAVPLAYMLARLPRHPRAVLVLAAFYAGFVGLSIAFLTYFSAGGFVQKIFFYQFSWDWDAYLFLARPFAERYGLLPLVAFLAAVGLCVRHRRLTFGAWWLALTALKSLTAGTDGGNHNHFVEVLAASTLVAGQGLAALVAGTPPAHPTASADGTHVRSWAWRLCLCYAAGATILALTVAATSEQDGKGTWLAWEYHLPSVEEWRGNEDALSRIAHATGPIYGDNAGLGLVVLTGRVPQITDPFTLAAEVRMGRWDDSAVVADIAAGHYQYIVLRGDLARMDPAHPPGDLTPGILRAIHAHYRLVEQGFVWIYAPKPKGDLVPLA